MMEKASARAINVRLDASDLEALAWVLEYVREQAGRGINVTESDAVRWAIHTCRAGLSATVDGSDTE